jgi:hypothetical protein
LIGIEPTGGRPIFFLALETLDRFMLFLVPEKYAYRNNRSEALVMALSKVQKDELLRIQRHGLEGATIAPGTSVTIEALIRRGYIDKTEQTKKNEDKARRSLAEAYTPTGSDRDRVVALSRGNAQIILDGYNARYTVTDAGAEVLKFPA